MNAPYQTKAAAMDKCSLVCHLVAFPIGLLYLLWVVLPDESLEALNITYYPPKEWAFSIPGSAISLFFAIPMLYYAMNSLTVPAPTSMDLIVDEYTRKPTNPSQTGPSVTAALPDICDLDPADIVWYPRQSEMPK